jgi:predicted ATPase/class 3 adenylate cyclase
MSTLPTGTVTFLFTDIEGSTRLLQQLGENYGELVAEYRRLLRTAFQEKGGQEVDTQGDASFFAFPRAKKAVLAAIAAQRAITGFSWPEGARVLARMAIHTGEPLSANTGYVGIDVHRAARICAAGHGGQILLSDATQALVAEELPEGVALRDLGGHRLKDLAHSHHLFQVVVADLRADFPPLKSLDLLPNILPRQLTSFVGREKEMAEVKNSLSTASLLTLTGVGGSGKTRLALQIAAHLLEEYPDGVWWVELAALADPGLVPQTVASNLGIREQPGRPLAETLLDYLRPKKLLLVVDNCEHLLSACTQLANSVLRSSSNLKILVTSREGLGIAGETLYPVPSLSFPDPQRLPPVEQLTQYEAVRLFTDRATAILPTFMVTEHNAHAVAQVCRRLDGIPLAVELAAARVKVLPVEQIASRLNDQFNLLTGGSRTALPRHQTLRATMDWSYDRLLQKEQVLLRRLSVFAGGWTLEAAGAVCSGKRLKADEILDLLAELVDKSLVVAEPQYEEARYRLLETVRQYALDRLLKSGEETAVRQRHQDWYLGLAERAESGLRGPDNAIWLARLSLDYDNVRAALDWNETEEGRKAGLRLAGALWYFWDLRGFYREGRERLEKTLAGAARPSPLLRVKALNGAGIMAYRHGDYARVPVLCGEALALCQELGDRWGTALSLHFLAHAAQAKGDHTSAEEMMTESVSLFRELGETWGFAWSTNCLGEVALNQSNYEKAAVLFEDSLALFRELKQNFLTAVSFLNLGHVAQHRGNYVRAAALFGESLRLSREQEHTWLTVHNLSGLAGVAATKGQLERAAQIIGAVEGLSSNFGVVLEHTYRVPYELNVAAVGAALDERTFKRLRAEGGAMTLEQAIEYALRVDT